MKPVIGVSPDYNAGDRPDMGGREPTYFLRARYIAAIEAVGGIPLILPLAVSARARRALLERLDGLLLTGSGPDLPPILYGERQRFPFRVMSPARYDFELEMIKLAGARSVPMLGICGGMQAINVAMGGSLVQDIPAQYDRPLPHRQTARATALSHSVSVSPRTLLRRITRHDTMRVNSSHHQSVKEVGRGLSPSALAPDGVIEAIEAEDHRQPFLLGVQWHPEFLYDRHAVHRRVFSAFVRAARQGVRRPH